MMTTERRVVRVLSPSRGGGTILLMVALRTLSTQFNLGFLLMSLAQHIKNVVQLDVKHGD
jgi:2-phospho-L-lactate guanylyltransferase (CobY/MobA/RfbA family)